MDNTASMLVPAGDQGTGGSVPLAETIHARQKMQVLEQGISGLRKSGRQQQEIVGQIEGAMKAMVTETDLRRALGLAFQEFEGRLQETFTESNQRFLQMFSKKEEVSEVQGLMSKKVNWAEHNTVLKKLSDLRAYVDDTAKSVFVGHLEALDQQFGRKADATMVDLALKSKADFTDMTEVRARLERLEILFTHSDAQNRERLEELRDDMSERRETQGAHLQGQLDAHSETMAGLRDVLARDSDRISSTESQCWELKERTNVLRERQDGLLERQEGLMRGLAEAQENAVSLQAAQEKNEADQRDLAVGLTTLGEDFRSEGGAAAKKFELHNEQIEFLMQATEMLKRRLREASKAHKDSCNELTEQHEGLLEKLSALERSLKQQGRDVKSLGGDSLVGKAISQKAIGPAPTPDAHLLSVLEQLEQIAAAPAGDGTFDPKRPLLPIAGDVTRTKDAYPAGSLSARLPGLPGTYGQSPRGASQPRSAKKKEKTLR